MEFEDVMEQQISYHFCDEDLSIEHEAEHLK